MFANVLNIFGIIKKKLINREKSLIKVKNPVVKGVFPAICFPNPFHSVLFLLALKIHGS